MSPLELKASQQIRLKRLHPKAVYKKDLAQLIVPVKGGRGVATEVVDVLQRMFPPPEPADTAA